MANGQQSPLDEVQWTAPAIAQEMGGIQTNTVLPYFSQSPFFDAMSNNATLTTQAFNNPNMFHYIQTREAFEGRLRTMQGLEFMVTHDPSENGTKVENSGIWVIRKQNRRKRQGMQDEITPIDCYYVVNENVYMAPSVGSIIGSRMLSAVTSLTKLLSAASTLPTFTPATGHTYLSQQVKSAIPNASIHATQASKENTPMPGGTPMPATQDTASTKGHASPKAASDTDYQGLQLQNESFSLLMRYGNEYMDENPIVGEPGNFKLAKSTNPALAAFAATNRTSIDPVKAPTPAKTDPTPQLKTDDLPAPAKRPSKGGEKSPTTPGGVKEKKARRKSKAVGGGDTFASKVSTPKPTTPGG
ncbi:hypothetical protein N7G274_008087 [Stereocaulon virgatum]|uniref:Mediator of RNA polymerase II transcription subunit 6 n=1 Tax=Stereocaulon virgatum TaxID=373712 RepID=A0ABR4A6S4_9LECA